MYRPFPLSALLLIVLFSISTLRSQQKVTFGKLSNAEKNLTVYDKDPEANAVVLYERGDNHFEVINHRIRLIKKYRTKIKILDEKGFDQGTITIPLYKNEKSNEKIEDLRAVTHVGNNQYRVLSSEIFTKDASEYRTEKSFTFPKLQKGCILEYSYTVISPFIYNLRGWDFQSDIPKIHSEFNAKIPGNYVYNRALIGSLKLDANEVEIQKNCFHIDGYAQSAGCEVLHYAIKDIPAFKAEKGYMLSEKNYISRIDFELSEHHGLDGTTDRYTKSWEDVDQEFKSDKDIGRQLTKKGFFEKNVPESLLTDGDAMTRAKNIYEFVKQHYTWTGEFGIYGKARVKQAFDDRKGSVGEINMSLINLLNSADIKTDLMLLSTRNEGLPKRSHPVMSDFNYPIAKVKIDGKDYLLDATDKQMPFGMLPFRALNHYGRVMDFDNESYWYNIKPEKKNLYQVRAHVKFDVDGGKAEGILDMVTYGYAAVDKNRSLQRMDKTEYLDQWENEVGGDFKIVSHEHLKEKSTDRKALERFSFELQNVLQSDMVYFNPFFIRFFDENPFLLEERNYPIDFGYNRRYKYQLSISLPEGYAVHELPEDQAIMMGEKLIELKFLHQKNIGQVSILFDLALNQSYFEAENYEALKDIFKSVIDIQKNTLIILKKEAKGTR